MTTTFVTAQEHVAFLIDETNRARTECAVAPWCYEITSDVKNIGVVVTETSKTLQVNPSWLRFVIETGDFKMCVADEIAAWYLINELTSCCS